MATQDRNTGLAMENSPVKTAPTATGTTQMPTAENSRRGPDAHLHLPFAMRASRPATSIVMSAATRRSATGHGT